MQVRGLVAQIGDVNRSRSAELALNRKIPFIDRLTLEHDCARIHAWCGARKRNPSEGTNRTAGIGSDVWLAQEKIAKRARRRQRRTVVRKIDGGKEWNGRHGVVNGVAVGEGVEDAEAAANYKLRTTEWCPGKTDTRRSVFLNRLDRAWQADFVGEGKAIGKKSQ